jgi:hypothetical protein
MATRYVPFSLVEASKILIDEMGFTQIAVPGCGEVVFERKVETTTGKSFPYRVRIYSTIDRTTGITRENGADAIRLVIVDEATGKMPKGADSRVFRTKNALENTRTRARELFRYVMDEYHHCPKCQSLMTEKKGRSGPFLGCIRYKDTGCKGTREVRSISEKV